MYIGEVPLDTDFLLVQRNAMVALGYLMQAIVGNVTACDGLACSPTSPASLSVTVGPGSMQSPSVVDANPWGSLGADSSDALVKAGINLATTAFPFVPPNTPGYSQIFLIEGQMQETDTGSTALPYVNAANPAQQWSGPNNTGVPQYEQRVQRVALQSVAGTPAPTGSQTAPGISAGWTPLWLVTVANNQTTITAANIQLADGSLFIQNKLSQQQEILQANITLYVSPYGNDNNSGRGSGPSSAFQTITGAWNYIVKRLNLNGFSIIVQVEAGTYAAESLLSTPTGATTASAVTFVSNGATIAATNVYGVYCNNARATFVGFTVTTTGSGVGASGYEADYLSEIVVTNPTFGAVAGSLLYATHASSVQVNGTFDIGASTSVSIANSQGPGATISISVDEMVLTGSPTYTDALFVGNANANLILINAANTGPSSFSGSVGSGSVQWNLSMNATFQRFGLTIPGTAGAESTGGQCT